MSGQNRELNDLLSVPGQFCPYISNDHPPICQQVGNFSCLHCPEYLDGLCDLIPWDVEAMTENQAILLTLYAERDGNYAVIGELYERNSILSDAVQEQLKRVREEQGR